MKLTASIITATIALFATASVAESGGGFMKKCEDIRLEGVNYRKCDKDECRTLTYFKLWAECTALDDKPYKNELNLNLCLVNDHGNMQWRRRGGFDQSCQKCSISKANKKKVEMTCYCSDGVNKILSRSTLDLNKYIELKGNTIWCGDEMGIAYA